MRKHVAFVWLLLATALCSFGGTATQQDAGGLAGAAGEASSVDGSVASKANMLFNSKAEAGGEQPAAAAASAALAFHPTLVDYRRVAQALPAAFAALDTFEARIKSRLAVEEAHEFNERVERGREWYAPWFSTNAASGRDPRAALLDEASRVRRVLSALEVVEPASLPGTLSAEGPPMVRFTRLLRAAEAVVDLPVPKLLPVLPSAGASSSSGRGSSLNEQQPDDVHEALLSDPRISVCCSLLQYLAAPLSARANTWVPRAGALPPAAVVAAGKPDFSTARAAAGVTMATAPASPSVPSAGGYKKVAKGTAGGGSSGSGASADDSPAAGTPSVAAGSKRSAEPALVTAASKRKLTGFLIGPLLAAKSWSERLQRLAVWPLRVAGVGLAPLHVAVAVGKAVVPQAVWGAVAQAGATAAHAAAKAAAGLALQALPDLGTTNSNNSSPTPSSVTKSGGGGGWLQQAQARVLTAVAGVQAAMHEVLRGARAAAASAVASPFPASALAAALGLPASPAAAAALLDRSSGLGWAVAQLWDATPWALSFLFPSAAAARANYHSPGAAALREALTRTAALRSALAALPAETPVLLEAAAAAGPALLDAAAGPCKRLNATLAYDPVAAAGDGGGVEPVSDALARLAAAGPLNVTLSLELCPFRSLRVSVRPTPGSGVSGSYAPLVAHATFAELVNASVVMVGGKEGRTGEQSHHQVEEEEEEECQLSADGSTCVPVAAAAPPAASAPLPRWAATYTWVAASGASEEPLKDAAVHRSSRLPLLPPLLRATALQRLAALLGGVLGDDTLTPAAGASVVLAADL